jgi:methyltransferase-like protein
MCSRFTELFNVNRPLELRQYEATSSSTSSSTDEETYFSSSETSTYNLSVYSYFNATHKTTKSKIPPLVHSKSFTSFFLSNDDNNILTKTNTAATTTPLKSKVKRFLTMKHSNRLNGKSPVN